MLLFSRCGSELFVRLALASKALRGSSRSSRSSKRPVIWPVDRHCLPSAGPEAIQKRNREGEREREREREEEGESGSEQWPRDADSGTIGQKREAEETI